MSITLEYFKDYATCGNIYAKCTGDVSNKDIIFRLHQGGIALNERQTRGDTLVYLPFSSSGTYYISATIVGPTGYVQTLNSPEIYIPLYVATPVPSPTPSYQIKGRLELVPDVDNYLEVKFYSGGLNKLRHEYSYKVPIYTSLKEKLHFSACFNESEVQDLMKINTHFSEFRDIYQLKDDVGNESLLQLAQELECLDYVEYCSLLSKEKYPPPPSLPGVEPPPVLPQTGEATNNLVTPDFFSRQGYLKEGAGMNVIGAWNRPWGYGAPEVSVRLSDFGVYRNHEDLVGGITVVTSRPESEDSNHGTASTGVIRATNNVFGTVGIDYLSRFYFYDVGPENMDLMLNAITPGDIVAINVHWVIYDTFFPVTHNQAYWTRLKAFVNAGAVAVFSTGNGGNNMLQIPKYNNYGDTGAISIGACSSTTGRRLYFSNYNIYNSLNSWGEYVTTLGYGDLQNWEYPNRYYTGIYNGTSSATPLVAAVLAVVQSYAKNKYQTIFNSQQMHDIIMNSGYRQAAGEGIGYRPNTEAALDWVDQLLNLWIIRPWRNNVFYPVGALVNFDGVISQCLVAHTSPSGYSLLDEIQYWRVVPPWTYPHFYAVDERVSIDGRVFQSLIAHTSSQATRPSSPATDNIWSPVPA